MDESVSSLPPPPSASSSSSPRRRSILTAGASPQPFPLRAWLPLAPGGLCATPPSTSTNEQHVRISLWNVTPSLIDTAVQCDRRWNHSSNSSNSSSNNPIPMPSLSFLAQAVWDRLTGCSPSNVKEWADRMVLLSETEEDRTTTTSSSTTTTTAAQYLQSLLVASSTLHPSNPPHHRPCGYVFQRGDIAWNCRTCQTDPTCVICDSCFRHSNHQGHEVYFHRTTPGGCCDCGDAEAWNVEGCCLHHRPPPTTTTNSVHNNTVMTHTDAIQAMQVGKVKEQHVVELLKEQNPYLAAALGVVIGSAVHAIGEALQGAGMAADATQWRLAWAKEAAQLHNQVAHDEQYYYYDDDAAGKDTPQQQQQQQHPAVPLSLTHFLEKQQKLPEGYRLQLRLHNDDVHTFEEVIAALHEPRRPHGAMILTMSLVPSREAATDMTQHVDADGQVAVKTFGAIQPAMQGFRQLKSHGLHCAVVSTAQLQAEARARALLSWLTDIAASHPAAAALVVHALVQTNDSALGGVYVWHEARGVPIWAGMTATAAEDQATTVRATAFPPHLASSYVSREEARTLYELSLEGNPTLFVQATGTVPDYYAKVPYHLPSARYIKSPHGLWGTLPGTYADPTPVTSKHPLLHRLSTGELVESMPNSLMEPVFIVDTDLRKQQEADRITTAVFPHKLPGLHLVSGIGRVRAQDLGPMYRPPLPNPMEWRHLLATCSYRAPVSPILLFLLLDPYPTKQMRSSLHALVLSLLTDSRFRSRFAGAIGVAYRPLTTLFCAGVGTEADTPLHFTVQIFTAGSLVRALLSTPVTEQLLLSDSDATPQPTASIGVFCSPIAHTIVRCIHTNLLGATKEVNMILNNTFAGSDDNSQDESHVNRNDALLPALTYVAGEHPLMTPLPAAPDDGFLESRSTKHKRLPHLLRDLEYVIETPGTAIRLLLPQMFPVYQGPPLSSRGEDILSFALVYARMLRLAQGMDPQKRKISGGHVEYELNRWLDAFGLSLNFAGPRDAMAESPSNTGAAALTPLLGEGSFLSGVREASGNLIASLLREIKLWLYREGMLETGLLASPGHGSNEIAQAEALQRSTLHISGSSVFDTMSDSSEQATGSSMTVNSVALSCATWVKMTETQLNLIENALRVEAAERVHHVSSRGSLGSSVSHAPSGPVMGDWLRVPHSPLAGDSLSFHLPLHRALAKSVKSVCAVVVPQSVRDALPGAWWKIPVLDADLSTDSSQKHHPLVPLIRSTLRSSNCRVAWTSGPECSSQEAQRRRARSRTVSANIAVAKILHSLADHPMRCIAAAQQIERHLWARNGSSVAGMAVNYSSAPLCRSFRDLDILLVQLSAAGMSCGLGARRVFALLLSRFSLDGYLCDPERRTQPSIAAPGGSSYGSGVSVWVNPPRFQDPDHAVVLSESFFSTICVIVSELPPPPPLSPNDDAPIRQTVRRELIHALAAEPRSHSEAMTAATAGISRREETEGGAGSSGSIAFRKVFSEVLRDVAAQKGQRSTRTASGPQSYELKPDCCDEYDPTFFHLKRQEHQHAMDVVARLRKQKFGDEKDAAESHCLPIVCSPPRAHPRFLPCRLLLHLPVMDAALRRSLLFALTGGSWLPPPEPLPPDDVSFDVGTGYIDMAGGTYSVSQGGEIPITTIARRLLHSSSSLSTFQTGTTRRPSAAESAPFSQEVVAASSVSFLEGLQLLTLQVHTLEECAALHRNLPDLDEESRALSAGLSINSYLGRLVNIPDSLVDVWALRPYPDGPLMSSGSGERRGSILGLLIALYEHRADHASLLDSEGNENADDGHGGARALATNGLKWLLRFVGALVDGASSVGVAIKSAATGTPIQRQTPGPPSFAPELGNSLWTIDGGIRATIQGMLRGLPDLWPKDRDRSSPNEKGSTKNNEARKAAQQRVLEMMKRKQAAFAATIAPSDKVGGSETGEIETDLCIICRCDDADGENNGPLGYLGHVQRSRLSQIRDTMEAASRDGPKQDLFSSYRVVGHMGCQVRETEAMDSKPLTCLPKGSVVTILRNKMSPEYGVLSRRVLVRHVSKDASSSEDVVVEGWASVQSSQGYVILSPLANTCYTNSAWGGTRPIIRQCGHAAHLKCVETHTLSLHQRAAGDQPYDGRFAANIADGEFLCPLCKQLSNILIPRDVHKDGQSGEEGDNSSTTLRAYRNLLVGARLSNLTASSFSGMSRRALRDFGSQLYTAMSVPWEKGSRRKTQLHWHPAIQKWDYEEDEVDIDGTDRVGNVLRLLRQQLIAWAAVGHSAGAAEASSRGIEQVLPFGVVSETNDPWVDYKDASRDTHAMVLDLKRTMSAACGLFEVLCLELGAGSDRQEGRRGIFVAGACLADILDGQSWIVRANASQNVPTSSLVLWSELTAFTASMPCHVARDGVLLHRCEARATAASMWAIKGVGTSHDTDHEDDPPAPLAVTRLVQAGLAAVPRGWGSMSSFMHLSGTTADPPFRPGVASAYLYKPLLAWDMYILAGGVFSTVLANDLKDLPSSEELLHIGRTLLVGRLIQIIVTPYGFEMLDEMEDEDESCWSPGEAYMEGQALSKLVEGCHANVKRLMSQSNRTEDSSGVEGSLLLSAIGQALLPFSRALVLMLRACAAAIRERKARYSTSTAKMPNWDAVLSTLLCQSELMKREDGFHILKALQGPTPTNLVDPSTGWLDRIDRWIMSAVGFEMHHGSMGKTILSTPNAGQVPPTPAKRRAQSALSASDSLEHMELTESTEMDVDEAQVDRAISSDMRGMNDVLMDDDLDDSDEELLETADMNVVVEGIVDLTGQVIGGVVFGANPTSPGTYDVESDDVSSSGSEGDAQDSDRRFAHVSRSPILPYQPSTLGLTDIGPGRQGAMFEFAAASAVMADLSHIGLIHRIGVPTFTLIRLPQSFVELYNVVNKVKGRDEGGGTEENEESGTSETAICLLTGTVMRSGSSRRGFSSRPPRPPGACTMHARRYGSGIGIYFLIQKCTVLLMHNNKSAYSPSIYVDEHGEEDPGLRRGRPLILHEARYRALELLWRQQGIPREVAQIRSTSDRVIRDNWY